MIKSKKGREMITYISPIYEYSKIMQAIFEAIGQEFDNGEDLSKEILAQLFPQSATWGLIYWENAVNIATNLDEDIERRRGKIIAKLQSRYIITPEKMATIVKNYTGANVLVVENIAPYTFKVAVNIDDIINNKDLTTIVRKIKPSHLAWIPDFMLKFKNEEIFNVVRITNRLFLNFRGNVPLRLDGSWTLNGENLLNGYEFYSESLKVGSKNRFFISKKEMFKPTVRIEKNLWYLDGTYNLDGSKLLNSEVREEEL